MVVILHSSGAYSLIYNAEKPTAHPISSIVIGPCINMTVRRKSLIGGRMIGMPADPALFASSSRYAGAGDPSDSMYESTLVSSIIQPVP